MIFDQKPTIWPYNRNDSERLKKNAKDFHSNRISKLPVRQPLKKSLQIDQNSSIFEKNDDFTLENIGSGEPCRKRYYINVFDTLKTDDRFPKRHFPVPSLYIS